MQIQPADVEMFHIYTVRAHTHTHTYKHTHKIRIRTFSLKDCFALENLSLIFMDFMGRSLHRPVLP
jgi:hypothetical protein